VRSPVLLSAAVACLATSSLAAAAPPPPRGGHPRLFLTDAVLTSMKGKLADKDSYTSKVITLCNDPNVDVHGYDNNDAWGWPFVAAACALNYRLNQDPVALTTALKFLNATLDDYTKLGDGAGGDAVVQHDDGYWIRIHGPYAALAYDWLHDALPADVKTKALGRFKAWVDWYATNGYLNDQPGSNYHAGYVFAKTLTAIAAAGEDDGSADRWFAEAHDTSFKAELIGKGLAEGGPIQGGDWPEGWQYGPLSTIEYALAARAFEEQGAQLPEMRAWAGDVALSYLYGMPPKRDGVFTNSDLDNNDPLARLNSRSLDAAVAGNASDAIASWAFHARKTLVDLPELCAVFSALAEARGIAPVDFTQANNPLWFLAKGNRKLFVRSSWDESANWAIFTSSPHIVPDHHHPDASNFVFTRGADHLIVDPTPYGTLTTLTRNALTVDSNTVNPQFRPSQAAYDNRADMPWARSTVSGIAAARAELPGAFDDKNQNTDVPYARREWVFLPEGDIVFIDRARTDDPTRNMHVRLRSIADLSLGSDPAVASGTVGSSTVTIHAVKVTSGTAKVRSVPQDGTKCDSTDPNAGQCDDARFKVGEYSIQINGPEAKAVHVVDGTAVGEPVPASTSLETLDPANGGVLGASVLRGATQTFVVASSARDGAAGATLGYTVPGDKASRHVVFDAPEDAQGQSKVDAHADQGKCVVTITAGGGFEGHPLVFSLKTAAEGCLAVEDKSTTPAGGAAGTEPNGAPRPPDPAAPNAAGKSDSGCGCNVVGVNRSVGMWGALASLLAAAALLRRRRSE
jgi:hypothetical protein